MIAPRLTLTSPHPRRRTATSLFLLACFYFSMRRVMYGRPIPSFVYIPIRLSLPWCSTRVLEVYCVLFSARSLYDGIRYQFGDDILTFQHMTKPNKRLSPHGHKNSSYLLWELDIP